MDSPLALLSDPTRAEILRLVWRHERSAGEIAGEFRTTFGAVSQHLGKLREAGLVVQRPEGKRRLYVANRAAFGPLADALEQMWFGKLLALKAMAEADTLVSTPERAGRAPKSAKVHPRHSSRSKPDERKA